jgi:hypothetical protein
MRTVVLMRYIIVAEIGAQYAMQFGNDDDDENDGSFNQ